MKNRKSDLLSIIIVASALGLTQCYVSQNPAPVNVRTTVEDQLKSSRHLALGQGRRLSQQSSPVHMLRAWLPGKNPTKAGSRRCASVPANADPLPVEPEESDSDSPLRIRRRQQVNAFQNKRLLANTIYFSLWYVLSIGYNIYSKKALNLAPGLAWTTAWFQMALGIFYVLPLWMLGIRKAPKLTKDDIKNYLPVGILHSLVHVGGVVSMSAGAVSFTYIVKASEPAVSALLSAVVLKAFFPLPVYLALLPVMGGVALASVSELYFTWKAFNYAMLSNVASAMRGIVGKRTMTKNPGHGMNAMNVYAVLTALSTVILLPIAALLERKAIVPTLKNLFQAGQGTQYIFFTVISALFYYTYNEVAFLCLDSVSPVSPALGNTLKRVFIIISSMLAFGNKMTPQGIAGSTIAVGGVFLYSLIKQAYKEKAV